MKERLEAQLRAFNLLSDAEIAAGLEFFVPQTFSKGELLIEAGKVCDWMAFVNAGILRNYYISSKGEEQTYCLTFPDKMISAFSSFLTREPSFENIHGLTDGELLVITNSDYYKLMNSSENWLKLSRRIAELSYIEMESRLLSLQMESAKKRYEDILKHQPEYVKEVPLKYLASYLGISQRHLSRLRREISF